MDLDSDLEGLDRDRLVAEVKRLRAVSANTGTAPATISAGIIPTLGVAAERVAPDIAVPPWPKFLRGCLRYREALDRELPDAPPADYEYGRLEPEVLRAASCAISAQPARSPAQA